MQYQNSLRTIHIAGLLIFLAFACDKPVATGDTTAKVHVAHDGHAYTLIRNNEPFRIKGAAGNSHFKELKEAGGNTIRVYDTINLQKILDEAHRFGLAVIVDIPLPKYGDGSNFYEQDLSVPKKKITSLVRKFREHPALLYWNVGNELYYPTVYKPTQFFKSFNSLVDLVKKNDPYHPVSTAIIGGNRRRLASIVLKSPNLDLISINSFGNLTNLEEKMKPIKVWWNGPYVISEWGVNGPWEEVLTSWGAPIEQNSSEKARILGDRYSSNVMQSPNCIGSVAFYWGTKQERTHTWFSFFLGPKKSESYYKIKALWNSDSVSYRGPKMKDIKINKLNSRSSVILSSEEEAKAEVFLENSFNSDSLNFHWEIRPEAWNDIEKEQPVLKRLEPQKSSTEITFTTPQKEGPYRLFVYVVDKKDNYSTTNIPFYVLNPANEE